MVYTVAVTFSLIISIAYTIVVTYFSMSEKLSTYLGYLLPALSLCVVSIYVFKNRNLHFTQGIAFKKFKPKYLIIALLLTFGALFSLSWINEAFASLLKNLFGYEAPSTVLPKDNAFDFILCFTFICVFPAFFEECIFRGLLLNGCKRLGDWFAVVTIGVLFSLYHKSPMQTVYQFILGGIYALLVIKSGSIIPSMIMHFINNLYIIIVYFVTDGNYAFSNAANIILTVVGTACLLGGLAWLIFGCEKPTYDLQLNAEYRKRININDERKQFVAFALPGVIVCLVLWIANLITYIG